VKLKKLYWWWRNEIHSLALWFLCKTPKGVGVWLRARLLGKFLKRLGSDTIIQDNFRISNPEKVSIGAHCNFGEGVFITGGGGVTIGDYVGMGPDTKIWSVNHRFSDPHTPWLLQGYDREPVVLEDDVWLGACCFIMPGVTIGKGAIISAGTVLAKSVPSFAIVAGNPGRVVGWRKKPEEAAA
jgi:maltose O-acetyltransferase